MEFVFDSVFQNRYKEAVYFGIEDYFVHAAEQNDRTQ